MNLKQKVDWRIICTGLVCLTILEGYALALGYNGTLLKGVLIIMALVMGLTLPQLKTK